jgi:cytochrome oxidase Cu insertion factor (SCO1/SenC/PrrC family)
MLVLAGVVGYFAVVLAVPALVPYVRNHAAPNWALVATGLVVSILAVRRPGGGAWMSRALLGVNVVVSALFALFLYVFLAVPGARGPAVGVPAPDWTLVDQAGRTVRLADFRGAPLVLVFYRGHW